MPRFVQLTGAIILANLTFFDEEPMFDFTDWNAVHVILLTLSALSVVWEC